jgi:glycosyltransferase involved in cell wall biosynthesis
LLVNLSFLIRQPTGISTYALNLLPSLKPLDPTLLVSEAIGDYTCYSIPAGQTPDQGLKGHLRRLLWTQLRLPHIYRQLKANLLFSPLPEAPIFSGCRSIVTVHDLIPLRFPSRFSPLTAYQRYYLPQVLHQSQHLLCDSIATANDAIDFLGIPAQKITPVPLAYDTDLFRWLDLPQGNYFFYIGRHQPYKNLHRTIEAFAALPAGFDCQLRIAGPDDRRYTPILQARAAELGVGDRVQFMGYIEDEQLPIWLNQAIALVFPSLWEGFGLPVLEAMACGAPVITSNLSSLPEVAGDAALSVDPYNVAAITAAMKTVLTDSAARSQLRAASLARARQFSWSKTGQATVEVLKRYL